MIYKHCAIRVVTFHPSNEVRIEVIGEDSDGKFQTIHTERLSSKHFVSNNTVMFPIKDVMIGKEV